MCISETVCILKPICELRQRSPEVISLPQKIVPQIINEPPFDDSSTKRDGIQILFERIKYQGENRVNLDALRRQSYISALALKIPDLCKYGICEIMNDSILV